jgi:hypothetical protein
MWGMEACRIATFIMAGVPINNPASVTAWAAATSPDSHGGAIWGVGGIASDGNNPFVTTVTPLTREETGAAAKR